MSKWGYKAFFSSHTSNSRGVAILFNNNFEFKLETVSVGDGGNSIIILVQIDRNSCTLVNILYGSNRDEPEFYR